MEDLDVTPVLTLLTGPRSVPRVRWQAGTRPRRVPLGLAILSPLLLGIALALVLTDGGPVLFRQERVGLQGRRFSLFKFRSMVKDADAQLEGLRSQNEIKGHAFKLKADPRVTKVGLFLRRSSLDELPQLLNVLRGEMSLVGPRPPLPTEVPGVRRLAPPPPLDEALDDRALADRRTP